MCPIADCVYYIDSFAVVIQFIANMIIYIFLFVFAFLLIYKPFV